MLLQLNGSKWRLSLIKCDLIFKNKLPLVFPQLNCDLEAENCKTAMSFSVGTKLTLKTMAKNIIFLAIQAYTALAVFTYPDCLNGPAVLTSNKVCDTSASPAERASAFIGAWALEEKLANLVE
jgi:hypothetical protein